MPATSKECEVAAAQGKIRRLRELLEQGNEMNYKIAQAAAIGGHLDLLQWLARLGEDAGRRQYGWYI